MMKIKKFYHSNSTVTSKYDVTIKLDFRLTTCVHSKMNVFIIALVVVVVSAEESCHSFAGGNVYPRESLFAGAHEPQVSKVQSMWTIIQGLKPRTQSKTVDRAALKCHIMNSL